VNKQIQQDRRKHTRYPVNVGVEIRLQDDFGKHLIRYYDYGENIGLGGIRIKLWRYKDIKCIEIKEGARIQIRISVLDTRKHLELNGQIIWYSREEEDYNIGIQFILNDKEMKACLFRLVEDIRKSE